MTTIATSPAGFLFPHLQAPRGPRALPRALRRALAFCHPNSPQYREAMAIGRARGLRI